MYGRTNSAGISSAIFNNTEPFLNLSAWYPVTSEIAMASQQPSDIVSLARVANSLRWVRSLIGKNRRHQPERMINDIELQELDVDAIRGTLMDMTVGLVIVILGLVLSARVEDQTSIILARI